MKSLETKRLILRQPKLSDYLDMHDYAKDPDVGPMAGWFPHQSETETKEILKTIIDSGEVFGIYLRENDKFIGTIDLRHIDNDVLHQREVGYVIGKKYWNLGYATEALFAIIKYAFNELELESVIAGYFDHNLSSKRVQEKVGFKFHRFITEKKYEPFATSAIEMILTREDFERGNNNDNITDKV